MVSKWERLAPLAGALAVPFWLAGVIFISTKAKGSEGPEILASYKQHSDGILVGALLWSLGVLLFIWFLGSLRSHLFAAEGGTGRLANLVYGGGLVAAAIAMLIPAADEVGALNKDHIDASGASVLHHFSDAFFVATEYTLPIVFFAAAIATFRYAALPKWLGWFSVLIGIVLLIGPIGWAALIFATPIWTLIVSVLLWRRAQAPAAATTREPAISAAS
ncbi:MAG: hypothetical protein ACJ75Q_06245 [Gaiellaceae bacterium]